MSKTPIAYATVALLAVAAGVCSAQPPGVTPEMIATALPVAGAPLAEPGSYEVVSETAFGSPGHMVFHPKNLDAFPGRDTLPVLVWGNGGCAINSTRYSGFLSTIASHGFLVLATAAVAGEPSRRATADDLRHRLGRSRSQARRLTTERQDRHRQRGRHGTVVRRIFVDHARRRS
jgi:hypothetical protein